MTALISRLHISGLACWLILQGSASGGVILPTSGSGHAQYVVQSNGHIIDAAFVESPVEITPQAGAVPTQAERRPSKSEEKILSRIDPATTPFAGGGGMSGRPVNLSGSISLFFVLGDQVPLPAPKLLSRVAGECRLMIAAPPTFELLRPPRHWG